MLQLLAGTKEEELQDIRSRTTTHQDSAGKNKETIDTEPYQTRLYTLKEARTSSFPIARGNKEQEVIHQQQKDTTMKETTQILEELNTQKTEQEQLINEAVEMKSEVHYTASSVQDTDITSTAQQNLAIKSQQYNATPQKRKLNQKHGAIEIKVSFIRTLQIQPLE